MDSFKSFLEGVTVPLLLSLFGGAARAFRFGVKSWRHFMGSLVVSSFAGVVVHLLLQDVNLSASVKAALVGLSGYSGGIILDGLSSRARQRVEEIISPWDQRQPPAPRPEERREPGQD